VNIEEGKSARIVVFEGDKSEDLAYKFAQEYSKII
jgi:imidazolonepropionase-like amidohydrolase